MNWTIVRLSTLLENASKDDVKEYLKGFKCTKDSDLQTFLHEKAIMYENKGRSRTYLLIDEDNFNPLAYITLSLTEICVSGETSLSNAIKRKMDLKDDKTVGYLIGQIAKDDSVSEHVGHELIQTAMRLLKMSYMQNGGRVVCLDCKKELLDFYQKEGFVLIRSMPDSKNGLYRLVKLF